MYRPVAGPTRSQAEDEGKQEAPRQKLILADSRLSVNVHVQMPKLQSDPGFFEVLGARTCKQAGVPRTAVSNVIDTLRSGASATNRSG
jgi:hypothetical protein